MIALEGQIVIAFVIDALLGDPRWLPHPVRSMGAVARLSERAFRRLLLAPAQPDAAGPSPAFAAEQDAAQLRHSGTRRPAIVEYLAGWLSVSTALAVPVGLAALLLTAVHRLHPLAADLIGIYLIWSCVALRDLCGHARRVQRALTTGTLPEARHEVSLMVGRDTEKLDESGVAKATVESVAENFVDGVAAPLFYAVLLGPLGALAYRVINTLDSMFGYRDERYQRFGWTAAKLDDCANYVPARLSAPVLALAAGVLGYPLRSAFRVLLRDGRKHGSPNAGLPEAAMAGALHIQLGGTSHYLGSPVEKPTIGDFGRVVIARDIQRASRIITAASILFLTVALATRLVLSDRLTVTSKMQFTEWRTTDRSPPRSSHDSPVRRHQ